MTFAHPLLGLILGKTFGHTAAFLAGSVLPDVDHLAVMVWKKQFSLKKAYTAMKDESVSGIRYKTPYFHSVLGWAVTSVIVIAFDYATGLAFAIGYFLHLILDVIDTDEKQPFYPLPYKIKGFLPVFSFWEVIAGVALLSIYLAI